MRRSSSSPATVLPPISRSSTAIPEDAVWGQAEPAPLVQPQFALFDDGSERTEHSFKISVASDTLLRALKSDGEPQRVPWNPDRITQTQNNLFRLKVQEAPSFENEPWCPGDRRQGNKAPGRKPTSRGTDIDQGAGMESKPSSPEKKVRGRGDRADAKTYYELLLQAHSKREDNWLKQKDVEENARREAIAAAYVRRQRLKEEAEAAARAEAEAVAAGAPPPEDPDYEPEKDSESEVEGKEEKKQEEEIDFSEFKLEAYNGVMELDFEIVVMRAPGEDAESTTGSIVTEEDASKDDRDERQSTVSSEATPRDPGIAAEIAALKEELGETDKPNAAGSDLIDAASKDNIWSHPDPRWSLGLAGTIFFVPDAERYARQPSLPPPPPASLQGRRRMRLKPRLPLSISNGRYRDEHPILWPPGPFNPSRQQKLDFEKKLATVDFYASCSNALAKLPPPMFANQQPRHESLVGELVDQDLRRSDAWRTKLLRESNHQKRKEDRAAKRLAITQQLAKLGKSPSTGALAAHSST